MSTTKKDTNTKQVVFKNERLKELATINKASSIIKEGKSVKETLKELALILPKGWHNHK